MFNAVPKRLSALRQLLKARDLDAWIIPTADPHLSEYLDAHYATRAWLSGFTGSSGTLIVTLKNAALLTDSRYWEQAEIQLKDSGIELVRVESNPNVCLFDWCQNNLKERKTVGFCGRFFSINETKALTHGFAALQMKVKVLTEDLIDRIWTEGRPAVHVTPIFEHAVSPRSRQIKFQQLTAALRQIGARRILISKLEDIAWLTNLRATDLPGAPLYYSYAVFDTKKGLDLFLNKEALPKALAQKLAEDSVRIHRYEAIASFLKKLSDKPILIDSDEINSALQQCVNPKNILSAVSPLVLLKAYKTPEEIALIRKAMEKDGAALVRFHCWLDEHKNDDNLTELSVAQKLLEFRSEQPDFVCPSFDTICAFGPNAALPHYQATKDSFAKIDGNGFLLIDSGAQFPEGTTDITRTMLIGRASEQMKKDYTAVLRAHIRLGKAVFPDMIPSQAIDAICREPLWAELANFGHGTGHGVGFFLNVHEGPQRISYPRASDTRDAVLSKLSRMHVGMVTSNEPGLYRPHRWGIRIENLVTNIFCGHTDFGEFLRFETLTLCPIELDAVNIRDLLDDEIAWLNAYHDTVRERLTPYLADDPKTLNWLNNKTRKISHS